MYYIWQGGSVLPSKGLRLVSHDPDIVTTMRGSHMRGSTLRASAIGGEEADLLLPGAGRWYYYFVNYCIPQVYVLKTIDVLSFAQIEYALHLQIAIDKT